MFGQDNYIEENAFATGHQLVNVYGRPEKRYEVRSESTAIDVQLHDSSKNYFIKYSEKAVSSDEIIPRKHEEEDEDINEGAELVDEEFDEWASGEESEEIVPITAKILNEHVRHAGFGEGVVTRLNETETIVYIKFNSQATEKMFKFPGAFVSYLEAVSSDIQAEILDFYEKNR